MRILSITAGAAGMYCGSCSRDNALAVELMARGHEVTLLPLYTPTNTDEVNVSRDQVLFGGISIYLQQRLALFRSTPRFLDRWWDSPRVISAFANRSLSTDPAVLGDLMISMLEGQRGVLRKEFDKLLEWLADEPVPDIVNLPNSLLIGLARPLGEALKRPICCTLQGEDLFLDGLVEPYRSRALELIRHQVSDVECFVAISDYYIPVMSRLLDIPFDRMAVVPLGINLAGYQRRASPDTVFRVGYFARIAPEKGLHALAEAYVRFRQRTAGAQVRLEAAGYLSRAHEPYLDEVRRRLDRAGLAGEFTYHGAVDRAGKLAFLRSLDVLSVPATYDEPKGVFLLEAMASAVPVVQPRRGAFTEVVEKTGGGLLVAPDDPVALAEGLYELWHNPALRETLGERAFHGVRAHYDIKHSADRMMDVYQSVVAATHPRKAAAPGSASIVP
jgi:glycosyltransferase involved in cell wall biosynthesis